MADYSKRIRELTIVRSQTIQECNDLRLSIGATVVELDESERPADVEELVRRYQEATERAASASNAIERMIQIDDRQSDIRTNMKALQKERDELSKGLDSVYEQIGGVAFRLFREHPLVDKSYSAAFESLARYQDDIRSIEARLEQLNAADQGASRSALERIGMRGRGIFLRNRRTVRENQLPRLLQEAGRALTEGDFIERVSDPELNRVSEPIREVDRRRGEIDAELAELKEESGRLVAEFNTLTEGEKTTRAREQLQKEIDEAKTLLNSVLLSLGRAAEHDPTAALSQKLDTLATSESRRAHFDTLIERLQAGQRSQILSSELNENERRRETTSAEIGRLQARLADLEEEAERKRAEQRHLLEVRGDESELFDD